MNRWWQQWAEVIARHLARRWRASQEARGGVPRQTQAAPTFPATKTEGSQASAAPHAEEEASAAPNDSGKDGTIPC
jgi:hypothetical protein